MGIRDFSYFVIHSAEGWRQGRSKSLLVDDKERLILSPVQTIRLTQESGEVLHPIALVFDQGNGLYVLDAAKHRLCRYCYSQNEWRRIFCLGEYGTLPGQFNLMSTDGDRLCGGIAVTRSTLYIAEPFNRRVQAFHLPTFRLRLILGQGLSPNQAAVGQPPVELEMPTDIVVDKQDNLYVLDAGKKQIQKFNRYGIFIRTIGRHDKLPLQDPIALAIDQNDHLYVIDTVRYAVLKFDTRGQSYGEVASFFDSTPPIQTPISLAVGKDNVIFVSEHSGTEVSRVHRFDAQGRYLGFSTVGGNCTQLTVDRDGNYYGICDVPPGIVHFGSNEKGGDEKFEPRGTYYSKVFDSTVPDCQWHRLLIDADVPNKTKIDVYFHVSNQPIGSPPKAEDAWALVLSSPHEGIETLDALFRKAVGRYLQLRFELQSDGYHTPAITSAKIYFQRDSYLRYLPAVYRENPQGRDFLERFLSIFESINLDVEEMITSIPRYFDVQGTENEFLDWLGSWIAIAHDDNWSLGQKRTFLAQSFSLYKTRGTPQGLRQLVELFTGGKASIIEHFRLRPPLILGAPGAARVGETTVVGPRPTRPLILEESSKIGEFLLVESEDSPEKPFALNAYDFTLLADTSKLQGEQQEQSLRRLIEDGKPAHTRCYLCAGRSSSPMRLGKQSLLEVNTVLSKGYKPMQLNRNAILGKETVVGARHYPIGTLGIRSRVAIDTILQ